MLYMYVANTLKANKKPLSGREYLKTLQQKLVAPHMQKRLQIPELQTSSSTSTHETDQREDAVSLPITKKKKNLCNLPLRKAKNDKELVQQMQQILVWRTQT